MVLRHAEGFLNGVSPASSIHQCAGVQPVRLVVGCPHEAKIHPLPSQSLRGEFKVHSSIRRPNFPRLRGVLGDVEAGSP